VKADVSVCEKWTNRYQSRALVRIPTTYERRDYLIANKRQNPFVSYQRGTMEAADESGTGSILYLARVTRDADYCAACPYPPRI
jgi:hypothetical protein